MELVVKIVNSIRGKALKRRLFRELMDEVDCHYGDLLGVTRKRKTNY